MGEIIMTSSGGGADTSVVTATANDVVKNKVIVDAEGNPLTGTLELSGTAADGDVLKNKTYYNTDLKTKRTGTLATMAGGTYTPTASAQTISCSGKKMTSNIVINAIPSKYTNIGTYVKYANTNGYPYKVGSFPKRANTWPTAKSASMVTDSATINSSICPKNPNILYIWVLYLIWYDGSTPYYGIASASTSFITSLNAILSTSEASSPYYNKFFSRYGYETTHCFVTGCETMITLDMITSGDTSYRLSARHMGMLASAQTPMNLELAIGLVAAIPLS